MEHKMIATESMLVDLKSDRKILFENDDVRVRKVQKDCLELHFSYNLLQRRVPIKLVLVNFEDSSLSSGKVLVFRVKSIVAPILFVTILVSLLINIVCYLKGVHSYKMLIHFVFSLVLMLTCYLSVQSQLVEFEESWEKSLAGAPRDTARDTPRP